MREAASKDSNAFLRSSPVRVETVFLFFTSFYIIIYFVMEKIDKKNEAAAKTGNKILIVDDDPHMRSALSLSLKKTRKEGDIFASAEEA